MQGVSNDQRLAIQMWDEIRAHIRDAKRPKDVNGHTITDLKYKFMLDHNVLWAHGCWFCAYVRYNDKIHGEGCQRCPLSDGYASTIEGSTSGCSNNAYYRVLHARMRKTKLKACDEIIATLKGEIYGKRKSASGNGRSIRRNDTTK